MRFSITCLTVSTLALMTAGCAQHSATTSENSLAEIRYEVGPCYGTCPVYSVAVEEDGTTHYTGNVTLPKKVSALRQAIRLFFVRCKSD